MASTEEQGCYFGCGKSVNAKLKGGAITACCHTVAMQNVHVAGYVGCLPSRCVIRLR